MGSLTGKVALVTGATKNMGATIAATRADAGATIIGAGRSVDDGERVAQEIRDKSGSAMFIRTDISVEDDVRNCTEQGVAEFGHLDILVNNAAPIDDLQSGADQPITELETTDMQRVVQVGIFGTAWCLKYAIPHITAVGGVATDFLFNHPTVGPSMRSILLTRPGLASDDAGFMTGTIIPCDGGTTAKVFPPDISAAVARGQTEGHTNE